MSPLSKLLRAATAAAVLGSVSYAGMAAANADPNETLVSVLSKGYSTSNCSAKDPSSGMVAVMECGQNSLEGGPVVGKYMLFGNTTDLASAFTASIKDDTLAKCGDADSPTTWHQGNATTSAGQVACGTYQGQAEVIWTTDAKNVLSFIRASNTDTAALYQWWRTNG
ncbi:MULTISPECIES: serine/threonine protein kinase [Mycobacterium]|uniref:Serine/threonine protein kinase n=1 Tax=Mycobacterium kiyosense TaxID=2871094 RepID=A0A9P3V100_9MYCO|nr:MULTISPECIES: serine/threonine protein kinase [Mycobacterium]BDB40281.1 hypothetical protein IWGMT90018_07270 [Mycobacterium kiyosense]BDE12103.1 hypothetical protein MKCMC460_09630 [Mycobacterium sp. 20KCMC460]GLB83872.1 hypothetical protein SRL2020028_31280 [Mycobacterium kiyosense]GLB88742.1 hypothetical protein SRL2020130_15590 [Mycobacterium kiyosense]GLB96399.1 hypothetical protein SRL2020226_31750 [Mycobacterium kiyosense]